VNTATEIESKPNHPYQVKGEARVYYFAWLTCKIVDLGTMIGIVLWLLWVASALTDSDRTVLMTDSEGAILLLLLAVAVLAGTVLAPFFHRRAWWHVAGSRKEKHAEPAWAYFARNSGVIALSTVVFLLMLASGNTFLFLGSGFFAAAIGTAFIFVGVQETLTRGAGRVRRIVDAWLTVAFNAAVVIAGLMAGLPGYDHPIRSGAIFGVIIGLLIVAAGFFKKGSRTTAHRDRQTRKSVKL
jgi:MFS family permease